jgi:hypothetical protein
MNLTPEAQHVRNARRETGVIYPYGLSGTPLNGGSIVASQDSKKVAISATLSTSLLSELVLKASAPLAEDEPRTAVLQLDGLVNKSSVGAEWRYGQQRLPSGADMTTLTDALWKACERTNPTPQTGAGDTGLQIAGCDVAAIRRTDNSVDQLLQKYYPRRGAWYFSLAGNLAPETFKFSDATTFADAKERDWSGSGSAIFGYLFSRNVYIAGAVRFDRSYEAAKAQALCSIGALDQTTACPSKTVGPPTAKTLKVTEGEVRKYLRIIPSLNIGASFIARRDWEEKTTSAEVPLYFIKDKDGGLSGGVSFGYVWSADANSKGARFTVFVGQTFSLGGS